MYNDINYNEKTDNNIIKDIFPNLSKDNKWFERESWFMTNNIKLHVDIIPIMLLDINANGRKVLAYILTHLKYNKTVIKINRKDVLAYLGINDYSVITKGIKELLRLNIIQEIPGKEKDVYNIPINSIVKGNVNTMVNIITEREKQLEFENRENKNSSKL